MDMDEYTNEFIASQKKIQDKEAVAPLKEYDEGNEAIIRIDSIDRASTKECFHRNTKRPMSSKRNLHASFVTCNTISSESTDTLPQHP